MERGSQKIISQLAIKLSGYFPNFFADKLDKPVFFVGFNNSGKSTAAELLAAHSGLTLYPGEGNSELWFPGFFPWVDSDVKTGPIWSDRESFLCALKKSQLDDFLIARAKLGAYSMVHRRNRLLNDSGMLAALAPDLVDRFPDSFFVHFVRDGRVASYLTAKLEWTRMMRSPSKYMTYGCLMDFRSVLIKMAKYWVWTMEQIDILKYQHPGRVLELRYEDWWDNRQNMLEDVSSFIGVNDLTYLNGGNKEHIDLSTLLFKEIPQEELNLLNEIVGKKMMMKGYNIEEPIDLIEDSKVFSQEKIV